MGWQTLKNAIMLRTFDVLFDRLMVPWIERELREEDGMAKETKLPDGSVVKEWTSEEIRAAMKPDDAPEEIGPSLRMALKNRAEIEAHERANPAALSVPTWEDYNAAQYRATLAETQRDEARAEVESLRKDRDELQAAKNAAYAVSLGSKQTREDRVTKLESFPHQWVLDRLKALEAVTAETCDDGTTLADRLATLERFMSDTKAGRTW